MDAREHRPQLPSSCAYQPPSTAGVRLAAARVVLGRAVAWLSLDTAQQSARAKRGPELRRSLLLSVAQGAGSTVLTIAR
jgi:hypothetical protein